MAADQESPGTMNLLIVTREYDQREQLLAFAQACDDLRVVGEAHSGSQAIQVARTLRPDLMLLDAELPDMSGFDVMRSLRQRHQKGTIFITANARDRATALAAGALDCLLKPIAAQAFSETIQRACVRLRAHGGRSGRALPWDLLKSAAPRLTHPLFLVGEREHRLYPLDPEGIDYVESEGNYVKYHIANVDYIARESVKRLDAVLAPIGFVRIERSLLLNVRAIAYVQPAGHGAFAFTLLSGARLHSGRTYRDKILQVLPLRRRAPLPEQPAVRRETRPLADPRGNAH
jgi:two-component system, LytTR family, response regulator